ncbi:MAG: ACT domain-containing protein [Lentisphaerae bacterium]|nr:ACT domain-containing protein [Lentisphaerota bacterium]
MHNSGPSDRRRFITSVLVPDRVGLLRDVTQGVFALEGNIGSIRQNVVDGYFNLVFTSEHPAGVAPETLRALLDGSLEAEACVTVLDCPAGKTLSAPDGSRFVIMTRGPDKPGTIFGITSFLVDRGINIQEWQVAEEPDGSVVYIAQVIVPDNADFRQIQNAFRDEMTKLGLVALFCHENIFRATNEIGPIKSLITPNLRPPTSDL